MHRNTHLPFACARSLAAIPLLLMIAVTPSGALAAPPPGIQDRAICAAPYNPAFNPADFKDANGQPFPITNPYFPLRPGTTFTYVSKSDGEIERTVVQVTRETETILGVRTVVVRDEVLVDGKRIELTFDWYAQDKLGNVWYLGEDSTEYDPKTGRALNKNGSWEAGQNGAKAGIIMEARPRVGDLYRQEYAVGVAEDIASVQAVNKRVSVRRGSYKGVLLTRDGSCLESAQEHKYYAPGVGMVLTVKLKGGRERPNAARSELVSITTDS